MVISPLDMIEICRVFIINAVVFVKWNLTCWVALTRNAVIALFIYNGGNFTYGEPRKDRKRFSFFYIYWKTIICFFENCFAKF